ncbi:hypothetical protein GCM10020367_55540 [Streptomyces sannanensis]|uniref:Uncharacterized protein n=1 Tax=Streptomyces sannanensis TaxID=285536 RepID=A0ABP6SJW4_9ACTN
MGYARAGRAGPGSGATEGGYADGRRPAADASPVGLGRVLMVMLGLESLREATFLFRGPNRLTP